MRASLVAIGGPSCSGKTTFAAMLADRLGPGMSVTVAQDRFYRDVSSVPLPERAAHNFDAPDAVDIEALVSAASALLEGLPALVPLYDFALHRRLDEMQALAPAPVVIVEGTLALHWAEIRSLARLNVYVDADAEVCLARRIARDMAERGRTRESVVAQWHATVWPMCEEFVTPTRGLADVCVGEDGFAASLALVGARLTEPRVRRRV